MADRFYNDVELPDVGTGTPPAPQEGFVQVYGKGGKLAYQDPLGNEVIFDNAGGGAVDAYTKLEADEKFLDAAGDTVTGDLVFNGRTLHRAPNEPATGDTVARYAGNTSTAKISNDSSGLHYFLKLRTTALVGADLFGELSLRLGQKSLAILSFKGSFVRGGSKVRNGVTSTGNDAILTYSVAHLGIESPPAAISSESNQYKLRLFYDAVNRDFYLVADHTETLLYGYDFSAVSSTGISVLDTIVIPQNIAGTADSLLPAGLVEIPISYHRRGVEYSGVVGAEAVNVRDSVEGFEPVPFAGQTAVYSKNKRFTAKDDTGQEISLEPNFAQYYQVGTPGNPIPPEGVNTAKQYMVFLDTGTEVELHLWVPE